MTYGEQELPVLAPALEEEAKTDQPIGRSKAGILLIGALAISLSAMFIAPQIASNFADDSGAIHPPAYEEIRKGDGTGIVVPVDLSDRDAVDQAISLLQVSEPERNKIRVAVDRGDLGLGTMRVWDYAAQDGDVVTVMTAGFVQTITIAHAPTKIVIPHRGPGIGRISAVGAPDLIITVAVGTSSGSFNLIPLEIGQSVEVSYP